jgi:acetyl-CoA carboxylase carboxyl transferase subunit alpha
VAFKLDFEKPIIDLEEQIRHLKGLAQDRRLDVEDEIAPLEAKLTELRVDIYRNLTPIQRVQVARHPSRPYTLDYIETVFTDFIELRGDRLYRNDPAIVGGWARLDGDPVMIIGHQKGRDTKENLKRNFGMSHPEGYRKALRLMHMAERFGAPIITLIDTPGAYPGLGAEERGQAEAIARNLEAMAGLETPFVAVVIGEGGSGGALALGLANRVLMFENSVYSVISPEGCAAILWNDAAQSERAAAALKITAEDLSTLGVIDEILPEPPGGAHADPDAAAATLADALRRHLKNLSKLDGTALVEDRAAKFRRIGSLLEDSDARDHRGSFQRRPQGVLHLGERHTS